MDHATARALLGLADGFEPAELRGAYRAVARRLHPDRPGAPADATDRMAAANLAYAVLTEAVPNSMDLSGTDRGSSGGAAGRPPAGHAGHGGVPLTVTVFDDGSLLVDAPADETFEALVQAADAVGDCTYVDPDAGLLQILVHVGASRYCYLTCSLQGRAAGTEVFTTMERLDRGDAADAACTADVVGRLAATLSGQ